MRWLASLVSIVKLYYVRSFGMFAIGTLDAKVAVVYYGLVALGFGAALVARRRGIWLLLAAAFAVAAFRFGVGVDYFAYEYLFNEWEDNPISEILYGSGIQEIGFRVVGSLWKAAGGGFPTFVAACALVNLGFVAATCRRFSPSPTLSFALYLSFHYLVWTLSGMRQGITIAIGMHVLLVVLEEKSYKSRVTFWLVLAALTTIHASAIVVGLMYFLARINMRRSTMILLTGAAVTLSLVPASLIAVIIQNLPLLNRAAPYLTGDGGGVLDFQGIVRLFLLLTVLVLYDFAVKGGEMHRLIVQLYILSFVLYFGLQASELIAARISIYGRYLDILIFPYIVYNFRAGAIRALFGIALLVYAFAYLTKDLDLVGSNFVPRNQATDSWLTPYTHHWNRNDFHFDMRQFSDLR